MGLDSGVLSAPEYKTVVHNVAKTYIVRDAWLHHMRLLSVLQDQVSPPSDTEEAEAEPAPAKKRKPTSTAAEKATKSKKPRASTTKPSGSSAASRSTKKSKKPARSAVCVLNLFSVAMPGVHVFHPSPSLKVQTRNRARKQGQVVGPKYSPHPRGSA